MRISKTAAHAFAIRTTPFLVMLAAAVMVLCVGCASTAPQCKVIVSNVSAAPVHSVVIELPDQQELRFNGIAPDSSGQPQIAPFGMQQITRLHMQAGSAPEELYEIDLHAPLPPEFRGRVTFQIEEYNRIRVFVEPESRQSDEGVLPWDTQPSWVASPTIPGMSEQ